MRTHKAPGRPWLQPKPETLSTQEAKLYAMPPEVQAARGISPQRPAQWQRPGEWIEDLPLTRAFMTAMLKEMGVPAVSPGQVQMLADINDRFEKIAAKLTHWAASAATQRWHELKGSIADQPDTIRLETKETIQNEARLRRSGLNIQLGVISREAHAIVVAISKDAQKTAAKFAARREKIEREEAEKWGLEFQPSAILATAWQASWRLVDMVPDVVLQSPPKQMLQYLPIDLPPAN